MSENKEIAYLRNELLIFGLMLARSPHAQRARQIKDAPFALKADSATNSVELKLT